jgi:hypothetical protein
VTPRYQTTKKHKWVGGVRLHPDNFVKRVLKPILDLRNGIAEAISCPTLVCEAEGDIFFKGQPQELFDHLTCAKTYMRFTESEGAGAHCQIGAGRLAFARIYDWLDQTFGIGGRNT